MIRRSVLFTALFAAGLLGVTSYASAVEVRIDNKDIGTGQGLDDPTPASPVGGNPGVTRGEQARIVFQFAGDIWGAVLQSPIPITVSATFAKLDCDATSGVLGSAGTNSIFAFNNSAPAGAAVGTWYHSSLFDALGAEEANPGKPDINARFNGALGSTGCLEGSKWYFGLDGKQPPGSINFLNVVLHEMAHGLGFSGFGSLTTGQPLAGNDGVARPDIYSTFVYSNTNAKPWYGLTTTQRVAAAKDDGKLVFTGPNVKAEAPLALGRATMLHVSVPVAIAGDYEFNQAAFGPVASSANFSGGAVVASGPSDAGTTTDGMGCKPLDNATAVAGHIAIVDRGVCSFVIKATNAMAAGASGVIIANNQAGSIVPGGDGAEGINIPVIAVSQVDGNKLKANVASLQLGLQLGATMAGSDAAGNVLLYAPTVLAQGSSFSHYDTRLTPNALMEYAISADLAGQIDLDLTPALFKDEGWQLNEGGQQLLDCTTTIPTWIRGGVVVGANVLASAKIIAGAAVTVDAYRPAIRAYADGMATNGLIDAAQVSSLNACLGDMQTLAQWKAWSDFAPVDLDRGVAVSGQAGLAGHSKVYQIDVPAGALGLSLRTLGGTGDVSIYVKVGSAATPTDYTAKSVHARTNSESVMIARPAAGTYFMTVVGETDYSGVTVLSTFTQAAPQ